MYTTNGNTTSGQVAQHIITTGVGTDNVVTTTYSYTYDDNGNILTVSDGTHTTSYVYDSANQLIRENNQAGGFTHTWTYDNAGNILSRKEYSYTTGSLEGITPTDTVTYTYGDENWGDLLTAYDGQEITYDEIGNPLSDGTWNYNWQHGRELASMTDGTVTWSYTYNADGLRTKRTNGTTTYSYVYLGGEMERLTVGSEKLAFAYDAEGTPLTVRWNGTYYFYLTNLQGDVIAITDETGAVVVTYTYDAWGKNLGITGSMAFTLGQYNPLRYRGYVYDQETGLYYLQSRYYDPEIGRFINADGLIATGQGLLGNNMFAYCGNNPVMFSDPTGLLGIEALSAPAIAAAVAIIAAILVANSVKTSDTGAAPEYEYTNSIDIDCFAYALGETQIRVPGSNWCEYTGNNVNILSWIVVIDLLLSGRSARIISSYDSPIMDNEYRIALRTSSQGGYHFVRQDADGTWSEKQGYMPSKKIRGTNPNVISWDLPICNVAIVNGERQYLIVYDSNYYDSDTVYIAVGA